MRWAVVWPAGCHLLSMSPRSSVALLLESTPFLPPPALLAVQGLRHLGRCTSLEHLDLSYCSITAAGLAALFPLPRLSSLVLVDCPRAVHPPGMALLAQQAPLVSLDLGDNKRMDDGCMQVRGPSSQAAGMQRAAGVRRNLGRGQWRWASEA